MENKEYKYDVAFSFCKEDERIAQELNDILSQSVHTFIYSERQTDLPTDGEVGFKTVYSQEARIVVILYRESWGKSAWTRMEEQAIRSRAMDVGYDFTIIVNMDKSPVPKYYPKYYLWIDFQRWGLKGAASTIEARIREVGGHTHVETQDERLARIKRLREFGKQRENWMLSPERRKQMWDEYQKIRAIILKQVELLSFVQAGRQTEYSNDNRTSAFIGPYSVRAMADYHDFDNKPSLVIGIYEGNLCLTSGHPDNVPSLIKQRSFKFDMSESGEVFWREIVKNGQDYSTAALIDEMCKSFHDLYRPGYKPPRRDIFVPNAIVSSDGTIKFL